MSQRPGRLQPGTKRPAGRYLAAAAALALALSAPFAAYAGDAVPAELVPPDAQQTMTTTASGVQIYVCEFDRDHRLGWVFQHPEATLYDADGQMVIRHDAGPSWQAADGSRIVGRPVAQAPSANSNSIPQLLLTTHGTGDGQLSGIRFVQRLDTVGGTAPARPCSSEHQTGRSPYMARYVFLK